MMGALLSRLLPDRLRRGIFIPIPIKSTLAAAVICLSIVSLAVNFANRSDKSNVRVLDEPFGNVLSDGQCNLCSVNYFEVVHFDQAFKCPS
jgi:hypothetical protein